jgi:type IV secretion system protein VirD4
MLKTSSAMITSKIPLGYDSQSHTKNRVVGFQPSPADCTTSATRNGPLIEYSGEAHLATFANTGAGKSVSVITPALLTHPGSVVVFDPKGEQFFTTAMRRIDMGHEVYVLNPFNVPGIPSNDNVNVFDVFNMSIAQADQDAQTIASQLGYRSSGHEKDPFWEYSGRGFLAGIIAHVATCTDMEKSLASVHKILFSDDVVYGCATLLDSKSVVSKMAYSEIASVLQLPDMTRGGVIATAQSFLKTFSAESLLANISRPSSFPISDWIEGAKPMTIYLVIPPYRMHSHASLVKLYFFTLIMGTMCRQQIPDFPTLFIFDETSLLGNFEYLRTIHSVGRGYGVRAWSFWQSISQLKESYPVVWAEIIDNCGVLQLFGQPSQTTLAQFSQVSGMEIPQLKRVPADEQILVIDGEPVLSRRFNYLKDDRFAGLFDKNPYYSKRNPPAKPGL